MTTQAWTSNFDSSSDANFRTWGLEFSQKLAAIGLTQATDTGQINWSTVVRAATAGYEIWRFNDSLQSTVPIFIKIEYGVNGTSTNIFTTVGTGSNGSGTLTGPVSARRGAAFGINAGSLPSYFCHTEGFLGLVFKAGGDSSAGQGAAAYFLAVARSSDASGAPSNVGCLVYWKDQGGAQATAQNASQALRFNPTAVAGLVDVNRTYCLVPQLVTNTVVNGTPQAFLHWASFPQMTPVIGMCSVVLSEINQGVTFSCALIGTTLRTYLSLGVWPGINGEAIGSSAFRVAMLWE